MEFIAIAVIIVALLKLQNTIYTKYAFKNLEYNCYFETSAAYEGEEVQLVEEITNNKWLPLPFFKSEITTSKWLQFADSQSTLAEETRFVPSFFSVKSYQKITRRWNVTLAKRGVFSVNQVVLVSADLFGFTSLSAPGKPSAEITVYPVADEFSFDEISSNYLSGDTVIPRNLTADPFLISGVNEYTYSEPINSIHWYATAESGKLMVFNNDFSTDRNATVILNMQSSETEGETVQNKNLIEKGIKLLAGLFNTLKVSGIPFKFMCNSSITENKVSVETEELSGNDFSEYLLDILARLNLRKTDYFANYLLSIKNKISSTDIIIVSCFINDEIKKIAESFEAEDKTVCFIMLSDTNIAGGEAK